MSDVDVLVIPEHYIGDDAEVRIERSLRHLHPEIESPDFSWYSERRYRQMHGSGHLFAWHVWLESRRLVFPRDLIDELGEPAPNSDALAEAIELTNLLPGATRAVGELGGSPVYEAGIVYVAARNIAINASWLAGNLAFGRDAPRVVGKIVGVEFPVPPDQYAALARARAASQRGIAPPDLSGDQVAELAVAVANWAEELLTIWRHDD